MVQVEGVVQDKALDAAQSWLPLLGERKDDPLEWCCAPKTFDPAAQNDRVTFKCCGTHSLNFTVLYIALPLRDDPKIYTVKKVYRFSRPQSGRH